VGGIGPLPLEVVGGCNDGDAVDDSASDEFDGESK
jgi:hypothetical protein